MDDRQQNTIPIKDSTDLHLKYAVGCYIKFKMYYVIDSHKNKWKRLQCIIQLTLMIKINTIYAWDQQQYHSSKIVTVYAVELIGIAPEYWFQLQCFLLLWIKYIMKTEKTHIYAYYNESMELDIDGIQKIYIINQRFGYYEMKYDNYNESTTKYIF
eukprot:356501_1